MSSVLTNVLITIQPVHSEGPSSVIHKTRLRKFKGDRLCVKDRLTLTDLPDDMGDELAEVIGGPPHHIPDPTEFKIPVTYAPA